MAHVPMVLPWHRPDPCKPPKMQITAAFKQSYLDYLASLNIESELLAQPLTGIMCTIGSSCDSPDVMLEMLEAGMTTALVLLSKGTQKENAKLIENLRQAVNEYSVTHNQVYPLAIAVQTKGSAINLGALDNDVPIDLARDFVITLTTDEAWKHRGTVSNLYVDYPRLQENIRVGEILFIDGGKVMLEVVNICDDTILCKVLAGGTLYNRGQLSIPGVPLDIPNVTDEDTEDIEFAAIMGVDLVIAAGVRNVDTIKQVRQILGDKGKGVMVFARIDCKQGFDNITDIAREADGILFARGDLVGELPIQKIFIALKIATATCNKLGKPIYVTSHYVQSMITSDLPTQAEITDISNAILDGADGILLGRPVAIGVHPVECLKIVSSICKEAEAAVWQSQMFVNLSSLTLPPIDPTHAISISAVEASLKSGAAAILLATTSGRSAQVVARYRPRCHIIAISRYGQVTRQLNLWRGILPIHYTTTPLNDWNKEVNLRLQYGIEFGKEKSLIKPGDPLVLLNGWRQGAGFTNTLRVVYASESFPWVYPHKIPSQKLTPEPAIISLKDTELISRKSSSNEENDLPKPEALGITSVN